MNKLFSKFILVVFTINTSLYILNKNSIIAFDFYINFYNPIIPQEWEMFAPSPNENLKLIFEFNNFKGDNNELYIYDVLQPLYIKQIDEGQSYSRLSYYLYNSCSILLSYVSNIAVTNNKENMSIVRKKVDSTYTSRSIVKYAKMSIEKTDPNFKRYDSILFNYHIATIDIPDFYKKLNDSNAHYIYKSTTYRIK
jgi:hypothetical protein